MIHFTGGKHTSFYCIKIIHLSALRSLPFDIIARFFNTWQWPQIKSNCIFVS